MTKTEIEKEIKTIPVGYYAVIYVCKNCGDRKIGCFKADVNIDQEPECNACGNISVEESRTGVVQEI